MAHIEQGQTVSIELGNLAVELSLVAMTGAITLTVQETSPPNKTAGGEVTLKELAQLRTVLDGFLVQVETLKALG